MIQIKDIIHYYIGKACFVENVGYGHIAAVDEFGGLTVKIYEETKAVYVDIATIKPLLRRVCDMTEVEASELAEKCYYSIYGNGALSVYQIFEAEQPDHFGASFFDDDQDKVGFTVDVNRGVELSVNGIRLTVPQSESFHYLLKQGFDLWGLIESNQAIDQKTLNHKP